MTRKYPGAIVGTTPLEPPLVHPDAFAGVIPACQTVSVLWNTYSSPAQRRPWWDAVAWASCDVVGEGLPPASPDERHMPGRLQRVRAYFAKLTRTPWLLADREVRYQDIIIGNGASTHVLVVMQECRRDDAIKWLLLDDLIEGSALLMPPTLPVTRGVVPLDLYQMLLHGIRRGNAAVEPVPDTTGSVELGPPATAETRGGRSARGGLALVEVDVPIGAGAAERTHDDDPVAVAAVAFADALRQHAGAASLDATDAAALGRRAAEVVGAGLEWYEHVGEVIDVHGAQSVLGVGSRQAVYDLIKRNRLLGLRRSGGAMAIPIFQLDPATGRPHRAVPLALAAFADAGVDPYSVASWFNTPQDELEGVTPAQALRDPWREAALRDCATRAAARWSQ